MLTAQIIIKHGFEGKKVGEILKNSKTWSAEQIQHFINTGEKPVFEKKDFSIKERSVLQWFINNDCVKSLLSSSNTQKRQWLENGSVLINGTKAKSDDQFPNKLMQLVFFSGSKSQITMV